MAAFSTGLGWGLGAFGEGVLSITSSLSETTDLLFTAFPFAFALPLSTLLPDIFFPPRPTSIPLPHPRVIPRVTLLASGFFESEITSTSLSD